jgi:hypothetical protein
MRTKVGKWWLCNELGLPHLCVGNIYETWKWWGSHVEKCVISLVFFAKHIVIVDWVLWTSNPKATRSICHICSCQTLKNRIISSKMLMKIWSCMQLLNSNNKLIDVMSKTWTTTMLIKDNHLPCQNKAIQVKFDNKYTYTLMYIHTHVCTHVCTYIHAYVNICPNIDLIVKSKKTWKMFLHSTHLIITWWDLVSNNQHYNLCKYET